MNKKHEYSHLVESMKRTIAASTVPEVKHTFIGVDLGVDEGSRTIFNLSKTLNVTQIEGLKNIDACITQAFNLIETINLEIAMTGLPLRGVSHTFLVQLVGQIHYLDFANITAFCKAKKALNQVQQIA